MVGDDVEANVCGAAASGLMPCSFRPASTAQATKASCPGTAVISGIVALPEQLGW